MISGMKRIRRIIKKGECSLGNPEPSRFKRVCEIFLGMDREDRTPRGVGIVETLDLSDFSVLKTELTKVVTEYVKSNPNMSAGNPVENVVVDNVYFFKSSRRKPMEIKKTIDAFVALAEYPVDGTGEEPRIPLAVQFSVFYRHKSIEKRNGTEIPFCVSIQSRFPLDSNNKTCRREDPSETTAPTVPKRRSPEYCREHVASDPAELDYKPCFVPEEYGQQHVAPVIKPGSVPNQLLTVEKTEQIYASGCQSTSSRSCAANSSGLGTSNGSDQSSVLIQLLSETPSPAVLSEVKDKTNIDCQAMPVVREESCDADFGGSIFTRANGSQDWASIEPEIKQETPETLPVLIKKEPSDSPGPVISITPKPFIQEPVLHAPHPHPGHTLGCTDVLRWEIQGGFVRSSSMPFQGYRSHSPPTPGSPCEQLCTGTCTGASTPNDSFWQMARSLRRDNILCDAKLYVQDADGQTVPVSAHKLVLVCGCRYFQGLLDSFELDRESSYYCLDVKYDTMILLLDLLYGQEVDFDILPGQSVENLLVLARHFQADNVETQILCYKAQKSMTRQSVHCMGISGNEKNMSPLVPPTEYSSLRLLSCDDLQKPLQCFGGKKDINEENGTSHSSLSSDKSATCVRHPRKVRHPQRRPVKKSATGAVVTEADIDWNPLVELQRGNGAFSGDSESVLGHLEVMEIPSVLEEQHPCGGKQEIFKSCTYEKSGNLGLHLKEKETLSDCAIDIKSCHEKKSSSVSHIKKSGPVQDENPTSLKKARYSCYVCGIKFAYYSLMRRHLHSDHWCKQWTGTRRTLLGPRYTVLDFKNKLHDHKAVRNTKKPKR